MKALILTWEFPPFINGGPGMACYGLIKSMPGCGIEEFLGFLRMSRDYNAYTESEDETIRKVEHYSVYVREIVKNFDFDLIG